MRPYYTRDECTQHLEAWKAAELALATGQSYSIAGRSLTRVNLSDVMKQISFWQKKLQECEDAARGIYPRKRFKRAVPFD